ncbi:MAG: Rv1733c family protein [Actinomadura sp.]
MRSVSPRTPKNGPRNRPPEQAPGTRPGEGITRRSGIHHLGTRLNRTRRSLGFDRNQLRRPIDRHQRAAGLALAGVFLVAAPPAALRVADQAYDAGVRAERQESADRHQVTAKVLNVEDSTTGTTGRFTVAWTEPDGTYRTGVTRTSQRVGRSDMRRIWVDSSGTPTTRPRTRYQAYADAAFAGTGVAVGVGGALVVYGVLRRCCDRRRDLLWEAEWARIDSCRIS